MRHFYKTNNRGIKVSCYSSMWPEHRVLAYLAPPSQWGQVRRALFAPPAWRCLMCSSCPKEEMKVLLLPEPPGFLYLLDQLRNLCFAVVRCTMHSQELIFKFTRTILVYSSNIETTVQQCETGSAVRTHFSPSFHVLLPLHALIRSFLLRSSSPSLGTCWRPVIVFYFCHNAYI